MSMWKKWFTVEEANSLLPVIQVELEHLQALKRKFEEKYADLRDMRTDPAIAQREDDPLFMIECELEFMQIEARSLIQSFHLKGAQLKDIELGLVDFPSIVDGEEVLLCWKQGEERITHYHGYHEGFAGRKRLEEL